MQKIMRMERESERKQDEEDGKDKKVWWWEMENKGMRTEEGRKEGSVTEKRQQTQGKDEKTEK